MKEIGVRAEKQKEQGFFLSHNPQVCATHTPVRKDVISFQMTHPQSTIEVALNAATKFQPRLVCACSHDVFIAIGKTLFICRGALLCVLQAEGGGRDVKRELCGPMTDRMLLDRQTKSERHAEKFELIENH